MRDEISLGYMLTVPNLFVFYDVSKEKIDMLLVNSLFQVGAVVGCGIVAVLVTLAVNHALSL